ncbi:MAG: hypothetical protein E7211_06225 [Clostridium lundense]|nr:hypothetical protein [Clostridium lundense]
MGFTHRKYKVNEDFFKTWTADMSYVLGLITTDGNIMESTYRKGPVLRISSIDFKLLEKVKLLMNSAHKIRSEHNRNGVWYTLAIYSQEIVRDLMKLGLTPNKSLTCSLTNNIEEVFFRDYLRGIFDGDGHVHGEKRDDMYIPVIKFEIATGSYQMREELLYELNSRFADEKAKVTVHETSKGMHILRCNSTIAERIFNYMYYNNCVCLESKYRKFSEIIKERANNRIRKY